MQLTGLARHDVEVVRNMASLILLLVKKLKLVHVLLI